MIKDTSLNNQPLKKTRYIFNKHVYYDYKQVNFTLDQNSELGLHSILNVNWWEIVAIYVNSLLFGRIMG